MKKVLTLLLAIGLTMSLVACGESTVSWQVKTANGLSIDLPSDFGEFEDQNGIMMAVGKDNLASITISTAESADGLLPSDLDQETYTQQVFPGTKDLRFITYDNAANCNGIPAIYVVCTLTNASDVPVTSNSYILFHQNGMVQTISINYTTDAESSTKDNIDAILKSIKAV